MSAMPTRSAFAIRLINRPAAFIQFLVCAGWTATFPYQRPPGPPLSGLVDLIGRPLTVGVLAAMSAGWLWAFAVVGMNRRDSRLRLLLAGFAIFWWTFVATQFIAVRGWDSPSWVNVAVFAVIGALGFAAELERRQIVLAAEREVQKWILPSSG